MTTETVPCSCDKCRRLCRGRPGIFAPEELEPAAAELGLTLKAFFDTYLTVNWWGIGDDEEGWDHVAPGWIPNQRRYLGAMFPMTISQPTTGRACTKEDGYTMGPCALLGPSGCRLSFERRPEECRRAYACSNAPGVGMRTHEEVARKWLTPTAKKLLELFPSNPGRA